MSWLAYLVKQLLVLIEKLFHLPHKLGIVLLVAADITRGPAACQVRAGTIATWGRAAEDQDLCGVVRVEGPHGTARLALALELVLVEQDLAALVDGAAVEEVAVVVEDLSAPWDGQDGTQHTPGRRDRY